MWAEELLHRTAACSELQSWHRNPCCVLDRRGLVFAPGGRRSWVCEAKCGSCDGHGATGAVYPLLTVTWVRMCCDTCTETGFLIAPTPWDLGAMGWKSPLAFMETFAFLCGWI